MEIRTLKFVEHGDERGSLVAVESIKDIPFDIKRVYYIYGNSGDIRRGFHAHKQLQQVLICVSGSCKILMDDGKEKQDVLLESPGVGLVVDKEIWHEMYDFSKDCILLALASDVYNESDYIRNYNDFIDYIKEN